MRKVLLRYYVLLLAMMMSVAMFADSVLVEDAQEKAATFLMSGKAMVKRAPTKQALKLTYTLNKINSADAAAYIFQVGEDEGFVLVSADDNTETILGYAPEGRFDATDIPENMQVWLQHYAEEIAWAAEHGMSLRTAKKAGAAKISPLLGDIIWNQDAPFWNKCPLDSDGKRSYTGCVATATAQIMRYWKHPVQGQGSHSYSWKKSNDSSQTLSANFGNTTYDWNNMLPSYKNGYNTTQGNAVATLMYHVGVATEMGYSSSGSGTQTEKAAKAMYTYFGYDKSMYILRPDYVGFAAFEKAMLDELQQGRPVLMSGYTVKDEGHAFVCDGYDGEFFHINWGWGGYQNSYFALSALDPEEQGMGGAASGEGYHVGILGVMGIMPDNGGELSDALLGTKGLKLQAANKIKKTDTFSVIINEISNIGIVDYEGGIVGLAVVNSNNYFETWFDAFRCDGLLLGYYYQGELEFSGDLSSLSADGEYKIVPIFTNKEENSFWYMEVAADSPQSFTFTKKGSDIIFKEDSTPSQYTLTKLTASSTNDQIMFSIEGDAPYFHVKVYNSVSTLADDYIDFNNASLSEVPDGDWTVWACAADANKNDVGKPLTATVTVKSKDYNVYNLQAYADGSTVYFDFESEAPKFHVKVYNEQSNLASGIIDFKSVSVSNVPDGVWTVWVRPCDEEEKYYVADAASTTVTVSTATTGVVSFQLSPEEEKVYNLAGQRLKGNAANNAKGIVIVNNRKIQRR